MRTPDIPVHQVTTGSERLELSADWMHLDHVAMARRFRSTLPGSAARAE